MTQQKDDFYREGTEKTSHNMISISIFAETILKSSGMMAELVCILHIMDCNKSPWPLYLVNLLSDRALKVLNISQIFNNVLN
jgi:hypothetical protein